MEIFVGQQNRCKITFVMTPQNRAHTSRPLHFNHHAMLFPQVNVFQFFQAKFCITQGASVCCKTQLFVNVPVH